MAMSPETLDKINGEGAHAELMAARAKNASRLAGSTVLDELRTMASKEGIVDPEDSLRAHTGETANVDAEIYDPFAGATDMSELTMEQLTETLAARPIEVKDQSVPVDVEVHVG